MEKPFDLKAWLREQKSTSIVEVLRYAKKLKVLTVESYEHPSSSLDLNGKWDMPYWTPSGLWTWTKAIYGWLKDSISMFLERPHRFSWEILKINFNFFIKTHPFKQPWSGWVWTLSSLDEDKETYLDIRAYEVVARKQQKKNLDRRKEDVQRKYGSLAEKEKQILRKEFSPKSSDFLKYMEDYRGLVPVGNIWLNVNDPTVFYVDQIYCPFDDPRGWTEAGIEKAFRLWLHEAGLDDLKVEVKSSPPNF